jgi:hypothetical protein
MRTHQCQKQGSFHPDASSESFLPQMSALSAPSRSVFTDPLDTNSFTGSDVAAKMSPSSGRASTPNKKLHRGAPHSKSSVALPSAGVTPHMARSVGSPVPSDGGRAPLSARSLPRARTPRNQLETPSVNDLQTLSAEDSLLNDPFDHGTCTGRGTSTLSRRRAAFEDHSVDLAEDSSIVMDKQQPSLTASTFNEHSAPLLGAASGNDAASLSPDGADRRHFGASALNTQSSEWTHASPVFVVSAHTRPKYTTAFPPGWDNFDVGTGEGVIEPPGFSPVIVRMYDTLLREKFEDIRYTTSVRRPEDVLHAAAAWSLDFFQQVWDKIFEERQQAVKARRQAARLEKVREQHVNQLYFIPYPPSTSGRRGQAR